MQFKLNGITVLAPMAGVTDIAFRDLCFELGAGYAVSEMVSAKGLSFGSQKSLELMNLGESEPINSKEHNPQTNFEKHNFSDSAKHTESKDLQAERKCGIQIFGCQPKLMAQAAKTALQFSPYAIDINMGCPTPKIVNNGAGSALLKTPKLCGEIVREVCGAVDIPVTVKIRAGWDFDSVNAVEVAKICEQNGAAAITVHGRTREQYYSGNADWEIIKKVKQSVDVPVIGNGDIFSAADAKSILEHCGCDYLMIGRGALGNPWIFNEISEYLKTGKLQNEVPFYEKLEVIKRHIKSLCRHKGERVGMKEARKHVGWYLKGFKNAATFRSEAGKLNSYAELLELIDKIRYTV